MNKIFLPSLLLAGLLLGGCDSSPKPEAPKQAKAKTAHQVETATLAVREVGHRVVLTGSLQARRLVKIYAQEEGRITELPYFEGDAVHKDDVLVRLDRALLEAELNKARATQRQAAQDLQRLRGLVKQRLAAEDALTQAETAQQVAEAEQSVLETRLKYTVIRAPFDGLISERLVSVNDITQRYGQLLTLIDPSSLLTEVAVSELLLPQLSVGDTVSVRIDALGDHDFSGRILRIHPTIERETRQGRIEVELHPVPPGATAGQLCRVALETARAPRLLLPFRALQHDREGDFVMRVVDGKAQRTAVRTGLRTGQEVEVLEGLAAGDTVITKGFLGLRPGQPVSSLTAAPGAKPAKTKKKD